MSLHSKSNGTLKSTDLGCIEFQVLYSKKTMKVVKAASRPKQQLDGILKILPPPASIVTLVDKSAEDESNSTTSSEEDSCSEESGEENYGGKRGAKTKKQIWSKMRKKKRRKQTPTKRNNMVLFSGVDKIISSKYCDSSKMFNQGMTPVDDTFFVGSYEVEIISRLTNSSLSKVERPPLRGNALNAVRRRPIVKLARTTKPFVVPKMKTSASLTVAGNKSAQFASKTKTTLSPLQSQPAIHRQGANTSHNYPAGIKKPATHLRSLTGVKSKTIQSVNKCTSMANSSCTRLKDIPIPACLKNVLRPHQVDGIAFLWKALTGKIKGAILADEMGLGKSLMTIAVICALHRRYREKHFVLVCPSSLISNWAKEFDKWIGRACQPKRIVITKGGEECTRKVAALDKHPLGHVWILSYDLFRRNASAFSKEVALLAVDEGHRLKNTAGCLTITALKSIACEARLCITATPIQNNLNEFYSIADFTCPGILGDLSVFKKEYERPISAGSKKNASWKERKDAKYQSEALDKITKSFMIRRLQKDVLKSMLPPRKEVLLFCRPTQQQCNLYRTVTSGAINSQIMKGSAISQDALTALLNLRKLCSHPMLYNKQAQFDWSESDVTLSGKLHVLDSLLMSIREHSPTDKVVIVSNFTSALSMIESTIFEFRELSFLRLDGSTELSNRQALVDKFNRTDAEHNFAFLLSSKAGGCGINLIGANRLIMFDPDWNPAVDAQAMARIYRPGQKKTSIIYRFFTSGTVEEVIYQRQIQKGNLAECIVTGASSSSEKFTKEELADCFTLKEGCDCDTKGKVGTHWSSYSGPSSLRSDNEFVDEALIAAACTQEKRLSFVHFVDDNDKIITDGSDTENFSDGQDLSEAEDSFQSQNLNEESSDEEFEF